MNRQLISLALLAIFTTPVAFAPIAQANYSGQDPQSTKCSEDGREVASTSGGSYSTIGFGGYQRREVKIQLMYSERCNANWVKGDVPRDSRLYLKDESGRRYVEYRAKVAGVNFTDMWDAGIKFYAGAQYPNEREVCTSTAL